jgi:hypothetical protein
MPYKIPVVEIKFTIKMNQADKESILKGTVPINEPPLMLNSNPFVAMPLSANKLVAKAINITLVAATKGLNFSEIKIKAATPAINTMA